MTKLCKYKMYSQFCIQLKQEALLVVHWKRQKQRHQSDHTGHSNRSHLEIRLTSFGSQVYIIQMICLLALAGAVQFSPCKQLLLNGSVYWMDKRLAQSDRLCVNSSESEARSLCLRTTG